MSLNEGPGSILIHQGPPIFLWFRDLGLVPEVQGFRDLGLVPEVQGFRYLGLVPEVQGVQGIGFSR